MLELVELINYKLKQQNNQETNQLRKKINQIESKIN